jgi:membrane protein required for colicin V production
MTGFDYTIIAILVASLVIGVWRGLTYELLSLAGWPIAFLLSKFFAAEIAPVMPGEGTMRIALAYAAVFIAALILWSVLVWLFSRLVKAVGLGGLDRAMGGVFGLVRGLLVVLALVWLAGLTSMPEQPFWRNAQTSRVAEDVALWTRGWLPDTVAQRIRYGARG